MSSTSQQIGHSSFLVGSWGKTLHCTLNPSHCCCRSLRALCCMFRIKKTYCWVIRTFVSNYRIKMVIFSSDSASLSTLVGGALRNFATMAARIGKQGWWFFQYWKRTSLQIFLVVSNTSAFGQQCSLCSLILVCHVPSECCHTDLSGWSGLCLNLEWLFFARRLFCWLCFQ